MGQATLLREEPLSRVLPFSTSFQANIGSCRIITGVGLLSKVPRDGRLEATQTKRTWEPAVSAAIPEIASFRLEPFWRQVVAATARSLGCGGYCRCHGRRVRQQL